MVLLQLRRMLSETPRLWSEASVWNEWYVAPLRRLSWSSQDIEAPRKEEGGGLRGEASTTGGR